MSEELPSVIEGFRKAFGGASPTHVVRAPGRVNLIGEHTDYNGLPVFPMALRQEIRIAFRPREDQLVRFQNEDPAFPPTRFTLSQRIPPKPTGSWGNYVRAPAQALVRRLGSLRGMDAFVASTLPPASGLSSSSALVIATGLALLASNDRSLPTLELAEEMAEAERYTGTRGGGMDQAISLGARAGHASRIEFNPLRMEECPVPDGWRFVVAHTLVRAEKSGPAQKAYNRRTQECREALELIRQALDERGEAEVSHIGYPELLRRFEVPDLLAVAEKTLPGVILKRFRHVITEAERVYEAEAAMRRGDLLTFGILMDASHASLAADYEVSSPELDALVEIARGAGAAGARLTGAGFGGCMVALAESERAEAVLDAMEAEYYRGREVHSPLQSVLFVAEAAGGATVEVL